MQAVGCQVSDVALGVLTLHCGTHAVALSLHVQNHRLELSLHDDCQVKSHLARMARFECHQHWQPAMTQTQWVKLEWALFILTNFFQWLMVATHCYDILG